MLNQTYPQLGATVAQFKSSSSSSIAGQLAEPARQGHVSAAVARLLDEAHRLAGLQSELMKRLVPVSRMEPAAASGQSPSSPSTNCELADQIASVTELISNLCGSAAYQIDILEV